MTYRLKRLNQRLNQKILVESSKSETNRALLIDALSGNQCQLSNISNARDSQTMISLFNNDAKTWDVKDAGTTMRFCTAYLGVKGEGVTITGTERMQQRPIGPLVEALRKIGATVTYEKREGYPPLSIHKVEQQQSHQIAIPGNISSQYISALLMIAPYLPNGLEVTLTTEVFSKPYIMMTLQLMERFGISHSWNDNKIVIKNGPYQANRYTIESDWSGASYWYSLVALSPTESELFLPALRKDSLQGDQAIVDIMEKMGVSSTFEDGGVRIIKTDRLNKHVVQDFKTCPDLGQTVFVAAATLGVSMEMTGLESLKIKETDRIYAMQQELKKLGAELIEVDEHNWKLAPSSSLPSSVFVNTYEDHRMAMAFAPLVQLMDVEIEEPEVVQKSYPGFWDEVKKLGVEVAAV